LLGHVHAPALIREPGEPFILYPGSPQALDPGETGVHGPWLISFDDRTVNDIEQLPLSSVRYEESEIALKNPASREQVDQQVYPALRQLTEQFADEAGQALRALCLRLCLTGTAEPPVIEHLAKAAPRMRDDLIHRHGRCQAIIDKLELRVRPTADLAGLAAEAHPAGELARLIGTLAGGAAMDRSQRKLIEEAIDAAGKIAEHRVFAEIDDAQPVDQAMVRDRLAQQAELLLGTMLAEVETA
jgi:DNA repair exonuclease SbcCD nuclease subunit